MVHRKYANERNKLFKYTNRLNTTGKMQNSGSLIHGGCSYDTPTPLSLHTEKSIGNLNKEINDLILKQKESLKMDFDKAKEQSFKQAIGMAPQMTRNPAKSPSAITEWSKNKLSNNCSEVAKTTIL